MTAQRCARARLHHRLRADVCAGPQHKHARRLVRRRRARRLRSHPARHGRGRRRPPEGNQGLRVIGAASGWASAAGSLVCVREGAVRARGRLGAPLQPKRSEAHAHSQTRRHVLTHALTNTSAHTSRAWAGFMRDRDNKQHMAGVRPSARPFRLWFCLCAPCSNAAIERAMNSIEPAAAAHQPGCS